MSFRGLVDLAKLRWRIERDYHDLKQDITTSSRKLASAINEGRGWQGCHHHAKLSIAAYGFLISEQERIPPSAPHSAIEKSAVPSGDRPCGAPDPAAAPRPQLDCHDSSPAGRHDCDDPPATPMLYPPISAQPERIYHTVSPTYS